MSGEFTIAVFTLAGTIIGSTTLVLIAIFKTYAQSREAAKSIGEINDAVNRKRKDQLSVFDMIFDLYEQAGKNKGMLAEISRWRKSFSLTPFDSGKSLRQWMEERELVEEQIKTSQVELTKRLDELNQIKPDGHE
jgi:hypothetical protein